MNIGDFQHRNGLRGTDSNTKSRQRLTLFRQRARRNLLRVGGKSRRARQSQRRLLRRLMDSDQSWPLRMCLNTDKRVSIHNSNWLAAALGNNDRLREIRRPSIQI